MYPDPWNDPWRRPQQAPTFEGYDAPAPPAGNPAIGMQDSPLARKAIGMLLEQQSTPFPQVLAGMQQSWPGLHPGVQSLRAGHAMEAERARQMRDLMQGTNLEQMMAKMGLEREDQGLRRDLGMGQLSLGNRRMAFDESAPERELTRDTRLHDFDMSKLNEANRQTGERDTRQHGFRMDELMAGGKLAIPGEIMKLVGAGIATGNMPPGAISNIIGLGRKIGDFYRPGGDQGGAPAPPMPAGSNFRVGGAGMGGGLGGSIGLSGQPPRIGVGMPSASPSQGIEDDLESISQQQQAKQRSDELLKSLLMESGLKATEQGGKPRLDERLLGGAMHRRADLLRNDPAIMRRLVQEIDQAGVGSRSDVMLNLEKGLIRRLNEANAGGFSRWSSPATAGGIKVTPGGGGWTVEGPGGRNIWHNPGANDFMGGYADFFSTYKPSTRQQYRDEAATMAMLLEAMYGGEAPAAPAAP